MPADLEFLLGLFDQECPVAAWEDFGGEHGPALRLWQRLGFLDRKPGRHPVPSCPHCRQGVPYPLGGRSLCRACHSPVDPRHLLLWRFDREAFLQWLARSLRLTGGVRRIGERLWQLGGFTHGDLPFECFFGRSGELSDGGRERLLAFRNAVLLRALPSGQKPDGFRGPVLALVEVLQHERRRLSVRGLGQFLRSQGTVRFDAGSGALSLGDASLGDVPLGSREYHLLAALWFDRDRYVPYGALKRYVMAQTGCADTTDEATFCQKLKRRIKQRVPQIDRLIATTNKGDGYRLRAVV